MSSFSIRFYIVLLTRINLFILISLFSNLCFCFLFPQAASCVTLYTLYSFLLLLLFLLLLPLSFRLPSDGPGAPGIYLSWLLLPHILTDPDHYTLGSAGSLLSSVFTISQTWRLFTLISLLPIILCVLPSSRSAGWTGGHVTWAPLGDASSCVSRIHSLYI